MKIRLVEAEFFHADGWTDGRTTGMTKLTVAFRNFANASKNCSTEQNPRCVMPFLKADRF